MGAEGTCETRSDAPCTGDRWPFTGVIGTDRTITQLANRDDQVPRTNRAETERTQQNLAEPSRTWQNLVLGVFERQLNEVVEVLRRRERITDELAAVDVEGRRVADLERCSQVCVGLHLLQGLLILRVEILNAADVLCRALHNIGRERQLVRKNPLLECRSGTLRPSHDDGGRGLA